MSVSVTRKKYKQQSNHNFPLHLPQQTKHHSGDSRYNALIWYSINIQWVFGMQQIGGGGRESTKLLGVLNLTWQGFGKKTLSKIEANAGMAERPVRDLAIEEALQ